MLKRFRSWFFSTFTRPCKACEGTGQMPGYHLPGREPPCHTCDGRKWLWGKEPKY